MLTILTLWTWLEIATVVIVGCTLQAVLFVFTVPFDRRRRAVSQWYRGEGRLCSRLTPLWDFGVHGALPPEPRSTVIVSNHASQADPFLISFLGYEAKWLGKRELMMLPFMGWSMWLAGDVAVRRGDKGSAQKSMARLRHWIDIGSNVVVFPEGTRSQTNELLPFKDGAFRLAIEAQADVLPIAVSGTRAALPKHSWKFGRSVARVTVGTPISTKGMTMDDLERLKAEARAQIERLAESMRAFTTA